MRKCNFLYIAALLLIISGQFGCSESTQGDANNQPQDTNVNKIERVDWVADDNIFELDSSPMRLDTNGYASACAKFEKLLGFVPTIEDVLKLAEKAILFKDSIEYKRGTQNLTEKSDSALFEPYENKAKQAMLAYREIASYGVRFDEAMFGMIDTTTIDNSILQQLPQISTSMPLSDGNFFFIGACTFFQKQEMPNDKPFLSPNGKPELRYSGNLNKNANSVLNIVRHLPKCRMAVSFGNALNSYENGPQEVKGIGSLIHQLHDRVPVFFLTEKGIVPAELIAIKTKLINENLGCISDFDEITVACSSMPETEILGIYMPLDNSNLTNCSVKRGNNSWSIDINNDGIPEFASIFSSSIGEASGNTLVTQTWFVNIGGTWRLIDSAQDLDCT